MKTQLASLGILRIGLISLAFISILIPVLEWIVIQISGPLPEGSVLGLSGGLIAPVMAPMLVVVILLDVIMAKARASDEPESSGDKLRMVSRLGTIVIFLMLLFWIPFFILLVS